MKVVGVYSEMFPAILERRMPVKDAYSFGHYQIDKKELSRSSYLKLKVKSLDNGETL